MARILRQPAVLDRYGKTRSPFYCDVAQGLFTRGVRLGARAVGWPEHEVEAIVQARIRGDDEKTIRRLVQQLHEARASVTAEAA
jgi:prophage regulatory protein